MVAAVTSVTPVISSQGVAADITLQPGTVIDAQVLKVLANDLVRIAVASLSIDVISQVPLQEGQQLQLAVSQTQDGVRLQIVQPEASSASNSTPSSPATLVTTSTSAALSATQPAADPVAITRVLTPLEALAVSSAMQSAATRQNSLSPLFANLSAAASSETVPQAVQQAASQLLAVRPALTADLTGDVVKAAFRQSGLFYEKSQSDPQAAVAQSELSAPDLKGALIVFRQVLTSWSGESSSPASAEQAPAGTFAQQGQQRAQAEAIANSGSPSLVPDLEYDEILLPQAVVPAAHDVDDMSAMLRTIASGTANASSASLQDIIKNFPQGIQQAVIAMLEEGKAAQASAPNESADALPAPPFRGAAPSAQPIAAPTIDPQASPAAAVHKLLDDTDAALARTTLLQIASLPDRVDTQALRLDNNIPRWNFEIPFVTPQGTAVAQFEISRDGGGGIEREADSRVWRARFSLNIEPAGPVHALVSLSGERTSVRMWAERTSTAAQLRANSSQLSDALRAAELTPGDIVIGEGAGPATPAPERGHFLDRAL